MSSSNVFYVYGCYGTLIIEIANGKVLHYQFDNPDEPEYADISRIDIPTYEMTSGLRINPGDHVSIMDLNFWSYTGQYFVLDSPKPHPADRECDFQLPIDVMSRLN